MNARKSKGRAGQGAAPPKKKQAPFWERDPNQKVGNCAPPSEYQWPVGHCPNPAGRPRKKVVEMKNPANVTPLQQALLDHANKIVGEINGKLVTNWEKLLIKLDAVADQNHGFAKLLLGAYSEASRDAEQASLLALQGVLAFKEQAGPVFEQAEKAGRPVPRIWPHPADLIIRPDKSIKIDGPTNAEEQKALDARIRYRDILFLVVEERMDWIGEVITVEEGRKFYEQTRAKFYRFHRQIPRRLYQTFPPFRTVPRDDPEDDK